MITNDQKEFLLQGYASPGLRQPAAALVQAACCQTTDLPCLIQNGCPQQAVEWKAAAGCSSPKNGPLNLRLKL
jgi:hypothetical protein